MSLESSKSRFKRSRRYLSEKSCLNPQWQRFSVKNDVLRAKLKT